MNAARRPSMRDVAHVAGVSTQTVSRVANGQPKVAKDKRERVLGAMRELGYQPNSAARAMRRGAFQTIGVVFHSLHPVGTHRSLEAISARAAARGYGTTLLPLEALTGRATNGAFTRLGEMAVDAVIAIIPSHLADDMALQLPPGVPTVIMGRPLVASASSLDFDQTTGSREAVEHLLSLGHRTIHHIAGLRCAFSAADRQAAWRAVLEENGRPVPRVFTGDWTPQSGYVATRKLLERERPTAIFVANDQMALGAFRAILEAGLRVPQDVSVVGFDDIDEAVAFPTPLTTVVQDWDAIGQEALRLALEMRKGCGPIKVVVPTRLVVRQSTGPARS